MPTFNIIIPDRLIGQRFDVAIAKMLPDYSRSKISTWVKAGDATIDDKPFKPKAIVNGSEVVKIRTTSTKTSIWQAQNIPLSIVFEDDDIIIINKAAGMVTHPGAGNSSNTLANALLYYYPSLQSLDRAGIVHRLDKNTSGLMVVARTELAQKNLIEQLQEHSILREYSAVVYGYMVSGGTIEANIGRDPKNRIKQAVIISGKPATTHYRIIEKFANHTHIKAILETGRTHQIRVHLAHIKHPLISDPLYGGKIRFPKKASPQLKTTLKNFPRHALHSKKLSLIHPISKIKLSWKSPLPQDLQDLLQILKEHDK